MVGTWQPDRVDPPQQNNTVGIFGLGVGFFCLELHVLPEVLLHGTSSIKRNLNFSKVFMFRPLMELQINLVVFVGPCQILYAGAECLITLYTLYNYSL